LEIISYDLIRLCQNFHHEGAETNIYLNCLIVQSSVSLKDCFDVVVYDIWLSCTFRNSIDTVCQAQSRNLFYVVRSGSEYENVRVKTQLGNGIPLIAIIWLRVLER